MVWVNKSNRQLKDNARSSNAINSARLSVNIYKIRMEDDSASRRLNTLAIKSIYGGQLNENMKCLLSEK